MEREDHYCDRSRYLSARDPLYRNFGPGKQRVADLMAGSQRLLTKILLSYKLMNKIQLAYTRQGWIFVVLGVVLRCFFMKRQQGG